VRLPEEARERNLIDVANGRGGELGSAIGHGDVCGDLKD
jgi:hypothetical protein